MAVRRRRTRGPSAHRGGLRSWPVPLRAGFATSATRAGVSTFKIRQQTAAVRVRSPDSGVAPTPISPRGGTKIAQVIELLQRGVGATLAELIAATGWLPHTMRAALTGLRKRGYAVGIDRADRARGSVYRIEPTEMGDDSAAPHVEAVPTSETPRDRPERAVSQRSRRAA